MEDDFYNKFERLSVQAWKWDQIRTAHVWRIFEAHDTVIQSYHQQIHGSFGADTVTSIENIREQAYVQRTLNYFVTNYWRKVKAGQSLSKMSKLTALHTEGTAKCQNGVIFLILPRIRKANAGEKRVKTLAQVQKSGFRGWPRVIFVWMESQWHAVGTYQSRDGPRIKSDNLRRSSRL